MKNKVSIIAPALMGKGGTETVLLHVLNSQTLQNFFKFELVFLDEPKDQSWLSDINSQVNVVIFSSKLRTLQYIKYLLRSKADANLVLGPKSAFLSTVVNLASKTKTISWIHFTLFGGDNLNPKYLRRNDGHLLISSQMVQQFVSLGIPESKLQVVYNPVNKGNNLIELNSSKDILRLVYVGRIMLDGQKNMRYLLDTLAELARNYSVELEIFGSGSKDEVQEYAAETMKLAGSEYQIIWHGWVDNPFDVIQKVDMLVLPSKYEGFGLVVAEAISRGLPVVATDYPVGVRDLIQVGLNGEIVPFEDVPAFAEAILRVKKYSPDMQTMIANSLENFSNDKFDFRFIQGMQALLERKAE